MKHALIRRIRITILSMLAAASSATAFGFQAADQAKQIEMPDDPRYGLLTPLPASGGVPPIVALLNEPSDEELAYRARAREYRQQIRRIRHKHFGKIQVEAIRETGLTQIREFVDPAAFQPLIEELANEKDDVRLGLLDHLREQEAYGQAALAWLAVHDEDDAIRAEAMRRLDAPASRPALRVLDRALRSNTHRIANNAGSVAGHLGAVQTIPLLIFAQATSDPVPREQGDLAWIAIQTQQAFVANLQPVVGDNAGAFQPILGKVTEGTVLRVTDAVVVVYRTEIHRSLVAMTTADWGRSTDDLGYDMKKWWTWYNNEYVPFKNEQRRRAELQEPPD